MRSIQKTVKQGLTVMSFCLTASFFYIDDHTLKKMECGTMIGKLTNRMEDQSREGIHPVLFQVFTRLGTTPNCVTLAS